MSITDLHVLIKLYCVAGIELRTHY